MTDDRNTKSDLPVPSSVGGSGISRGSERGACTIARWHGRPKASRPSKLTMKFRLLLRMRGNGRVGSSVVGLKSGTISVRKYCSSQTRCAGDQSSRRTNRMPASRSAGISSSLSTRYCSVTSAFASSVTVRSTSAELRLSGPAGAAFTASRCFKPETRISKNSSRFVDEMQRNFSRSSSGTLVSIACFSTRTLNASCDSSRLM